MRRVLLDLGVPDEAIWLEEASINTASNAGHTVALLKSRQIDSILLVTFALHMPLDLRQVLPDASALNGSARAMKELVGRVLGR